MCTSSCSLDEEHEQVKTARVEAFLCETTVTDHRKYFDGVNKCSHFIQCVLILSVEVFISLVASGCNLSHSSISLDIAQRIFVAAIRESARAILKRSGYGVIELPASCMM
eukprot:40272-Amphidinium_carterae.1